MSAASQGYLRRPETVKAEMISHGLQVEFHTAPTSTALTSLQHDEQTLKKNKTKQNGLDYGQQSSPSTLQ